MHTSDRAVTGNPNVEPERLRCILTRADVAALRDEESNRVEKEVAVAAEAVGVGGRSHGERGGAGSRDGGRGGDWIVNQPMEEDRGQTILHKPPK